MKKGFLWGASTAAYQIEGAYNKDGKSPSIWDTYSHDGRCFRNQNGDVACDHYNRYVEDVELMAELGINSYRFSISWSRIIPNDDGKISQQGIAFYSKLVDELLIHNITPMVTLFHWDLPQYIFEKGAFMRRDIVNDFERYVQAVVDALGDRVKYFNTINEAQSALSGYYCRGLAPGIELSQKDMLTSMHNLLCCHGKAVRTIRAKVPDAKIGFAMCGWIPCPKEESQSNIEKCRELLFSVDENHPTDCIVCMADAVYTGKYPKYFLEKFADILPDIKDGDMELISSKIDFIAQNIYSGYYVDENGNKVSFVNGSPMNNCGWDDIPESIYWGMKFMYERYKLPIIITENGYSQNDRVCLDGKVHDSYRIDMMTRYLKNIRKAINDGIEINGYYHWSLLDNFEWQSGYSQRFGLIYVDYSTCERIKKDSFVFYQNVIKTNGKTI